MGILGELFFQLLRFMIPWLQSGSTTSVDAKSDFTPEQLAGVNDILRPSQIPQLCVVLCVLFLAGCAGQKHSIVTANPGSTTEVVDEKPVYVKVVDDEGNKGIVKKSLAGQVNMPKSTYTRLRNAYVELQELKKKSGGVMLPLDQMTPEEVREEVKNAKPIPPQ